MDFVKQQEGAIQEILDKHQQEAITKLPFFPRMKVMKIIKEINAHLERNLDSKEAMVVGVRENLWKIFKYGPFTNAVLEARPPLKITPRMRRKREKQAKEAEERARNNKRWPADAESYRFYT